MNRSFVFTGIVLLAAGLAFFWYTIYEARFQLVVEPWIWAWGLTGTLGLALTILGVITGRKASQKMPARFCIHCGRAIGFDVRICPYCKYPANPSPPLGEAVEGQEDRSLAQRLGRMFGRLEREG